MCKRLKLQPLKSPSSENAIYQLGSSDKANGDFCLYKNQVNAGVRSTAGVGLLFAPRLFGHGFTSKHMM